MGSIARSKLYEITFNSQIFNGHDILAQVKELSNLLFVTTNCILHFYLYQSRNFWNKIIFMPHFQDKYFCWFAHVIFTCTGYVGCLYDKKHASFQTEICAICDLIAVYKASFVITVKRYIFSESLLCNLVSLFWKCNYKCNYNDCKIYSKIFLFLSF